ncbi:response regulator [Paraburkholderia tropica]|uniref:response regulator n=1 Tax=Paraburkholderia tropica TaxID=92647 RepID=UPI001612175C|nr:response regulator [Paraburkholderia tropica]MBB2983371.1 CheY-like chemotaxis protein [Paraburkholderia tropica]
MADEGKPLQGCKVLVVEDDYLVALAVAGVLEEAGASVIGPVGWADEALSLVESGREQVDAAILDVDLHGQNSYAIADALVQRKIRFIFATGYGEESVDPRYQRHPRCQKPFDELALLRALAPSAARS